MKKTIFIAAMALVAACNTEESQKTGEKTTENKTTNTPEDNGGMAQMLTRTDDTVFINKDTANRMISSYLESINNVAYQNCMASMIINADSLRAYLADTSIKNMKIMFAHTQQYMNSGNYGMYANTKIGALTLILAGYDSNGDYKFINGNEVMDNCWPCPNNCPTNGTAQYNILPQ